MIKRFKRWISVVITGARFSVFLMAEPFFLVRDVVWYAANTWVKSTRERYRTYDAHQTIKNYDNNN